MSGLTLEDFGHGLASGMASGMAVPPTQGGALDYETAYNAGWNDAMAQIDAEQTRVGERLGVRLSELERDQQAAVASAVAALEPMLHEVFDKLLPRAVERSFLAVLIEDLQGLLADGAGHLMIQVAPEEAPALTRLLDRSGIAGDRVTVRAEPALTLSQALVRWDDQERRIDLEAVLAAMDEALETFLATFDPETTDV